MLHETHFKTLPYVYFLESGLSSLADLDGADIYDAEFHARAIAIFF